jgi:hypothetical protein
MNTGHPWSSRGTGMHRGSQVYSRPQGAQVFTTDIISTSQTDLHTVASVLRIFVAFFRPSRPRKSRRPPLPCLARPNAFTTLSLASCRSDAVAQIFTFSRLSSIPFPLLRHTLPYSVLHTVSTFSLLSTYSLLFLSIYILCSLALPLSSPSSLLSLASLIPYVTYPCS